MKATFSMRDGMGAGIRALWNAVDGPGKRAALEVMGIVIRDWAVEAFVEPSKRPAAWPLRKDGTPSTLQREFHLRRSLRVEAMESKVIIGSDEEYALVHQTGGKWMPARPYLPVDTNGELMEPVKEDAEGAMEDYLRSL